MSEEIKFAYLRSHPLFNKKSDDSIQASCASARIKVVNKGDDLGYGEGIFSKIYLLINGKIKIAELNQQSNELIRDILTAPDIFGDLSMDGNPATDEFATALINNTIVCMFNATDFRNILQQHPQLAISYVNLVNSKLKRMETRHADLVYKDAKSRLIKFIEYWATKDGRRIGNKIVLNNYLTHTDIANFIATSRQSVSSFLSELRDEGLLHYNRKNIEITVSM